MNKAPRFYNEFRNYLKKLIHEESDYSMESKVRTKGARYLQEIDKVDMAVSKGELTPIDMMQALNTISSNWKYLGCVGLDANLDY